MRNHKVLPVVLAVIIFILLWHLLAVLVAHLEMLVLLGAVGAGFRYWGTRITPADDMRRLSAAWHRHRRIDPPR